MDIWAAVAEERGALLATFEGLAADQWDTPSLCGSWTVRQVLGHLVIAADPPTLRFARALAGARGSFDRANEHLACSEAARPVDELLATYRSLVGRRRAVPGLGPRAPLSDVVLHSFDVRIPLGVPTERAPERYAPILELLLGRIGERTFVPSGRPQLRWVASDHPWSHGTGAEVHGTMADLALTASGRNVGVDAISGPGHPALAAWLHP